MDTNYTLHSAINYVSCTALTLSSNPKDIVPKSLPICMGDLRLAAACAACESAHRAASSAANLGTATSTPDTPPLALLTK